MNFTALVGAIMALLNDPEAEQQVPLFIALAEAQMNRALHCREQWGFISLNIACERAPLPCDFQSVETIKGPWGKLKYVTPQAMDEMDRSLWGYAPGSPFLQRGEYTITGNELIFPYLFCVGAPPPAPCPAFMRYRRRLAPLSQQIPTNWCLERNPDAYIFGALVQSLAFKADDRGDAWQASYDKAIADIEEADRYVIEDSLDMRSAFGPQRDQHDGWRTY